VGEDLDRLIALDQYSLGETDKASAMLAGLNALTERHLDRCPEYARIVGTAHLGSADAEDLADVPYLPVSLFKWLDLRSVPEEAVFKVMTSSGTTGQVPSRVYLDVETARAQTRALSSIVTDYLGPKRRAMLIIDHAGVIADRHKLSARGAGILGMMSYGRDHLFALDADMRLDRAAVAAWLERHADDDLLLFGFTSMIWQHLYEEAAGAGFDLSRAVVVHSGGWKKLADLAVTNETFKQRLRETFGIERVHNFYGMVEQVGSVFFECQAGTFHAPNFADVMVRDPRTWQPAPVASPGVVEVMSLIPESYPGHALLTEDVGTILGVDDCPCGRLGRRFVISGRIPKAEVRGCSDTYERPRA
jgi:phenylacetate-coenzyme A ligase PaaK-like adenylate-forming protein